MDSLDWKVFNLLFFFFLKKPMLSRAVITCFLPFICQLITVCIFTNRRVLSLGWQGSSLMFLVRFRIVVVITPLHLPRFIQSGRAFIFSNALGLFALFFLSFFLFFFGYCFTFVTNFVIFLIYLLNNYLKHVLQSSLLICLCFHSCIYSIWFSTLDMFFNTCVILGYSHFFSYSHDIFSFIKCI